jgi:hypothetical protein
MRSVEARWLGFTWPVMARKSEAPMRLSSQALWLLVPP